MSVEAKKLPVQAKKITGSSKTMDLRRRSVAKNLVGRSKSERRFQQLATMVAAPLAGMVIHQV